MTTLSGQSGPVLQPGDPIKAEKTAPSSKTLVTAAAVIGFIGMAIVLSQFRTPPSALVAKKAPKTISIDTEKVDKEIFLKQAGSRIEALEVENDVLRRTLDLDHKSQDEIRKQISDLSKQVGSVQRSGGVTFASGDGKGARPSGMPPLPPPLAPGGASAQPAAFPLPKGGVPGALPAGRPGATGVQAGGAVDLPQDGIRVLFKTDPATVKKASEKKLWLNTGAIIPVKLLSGMDAPAKTASGAGAGGASQNSPYPVLMVVRDLMKLPNEVMVDARECFILGEGVGELSSERVQIRGTAISCVKQNGEAVDLDLKGFVNGEDGKLGLRGRVVMKEGALLGRTLLAGFVSGISQAFMPYQQGFVIAQSPNQAFNLPPAGPLAMAGAAGGMGQAARFLARHYSMMAASVFPVIEIDAQREVDFIVGTGRELVDYFL